MKNPRQGNGDEKNNNSIKENVEDCLRGCLSVISSSPPSNCFQSDTRERKMCVCVHVCVCCGKSKRVHYHIVLWSLLRLPYFLNVSIYIRLIYSRNYCFMEKSGIFIASLKQVIFSSSEKKKAGFQL